MKERAKAKRRSLDYQKAYEVLGRAFAEAESQFRNGKSPPVRPAIEQAADLLFASKTQSLREALLGCALTRSVDPSVNIRLPYVEQGGDAFSGRTLDEKVVNPFLTERSIPCSKGPYLATFRRSVDFTQETLRGIRDKRGYGAMLDYLTALEAGNEREVRHLLKYLLFRFVELREAADVPLSRVRRLSLEQFDALLGGLLRQPSGGLLPVLLAVAMFQTLKRCFALDWAIQWQGINVSDRAAGAGGDITIRLRDEIVLAVEVTERVIDRSRVIATFQTKILSRGIADYLFLLPSAPLSDDVRAAARQYFAQGHDIAFLPLREWLVHSLGTVGPKCRAIFLEEIVGLLGRRDVPAALKVAWNDQIKALVS